MLRTSASGATPQINSYDAYGVPGTANSGRFQYTGQIWLPELGMNYYKARMYSPALGRFMQTDPIGYEDNVNLYGYVGNDPVNGVDPTGKYECPLGCPNVKLYEAKMREAVSPDNTEAADADKLRIEFMLVEFGQEGVDGVRGQITVIEDFKFDGRAQYEIGTQTIRINPSRIGSVDEGTSDLGHEIGHHEYSMDNGPNFSSPEDRRASERHAYENGNAVSRALGNGNQHPDVERSVRASFETACEGQPKGTGGC